MRAKKKRTWLRVLAAVGIVLLVLIATIAIVVTVVLSRIERPSLENDYYTESELEELDLREAVEQNADPGVVYPELDPSDIQWATPNQNVTASQDVLNILLIGQDRRPGEGRARSDSMILATINRTQNTIVLTSFLRDLYVQIPGYSSNRLNAAYAFGGMELLDQTLEQNFGVKVDYNVEVDFSGFSTIIDALGGVDITLTEAEADYLKLSPGLIHMDGEQALSYSRIRYIDSDFGRTGRQRAVLTSVFNASRSMGLTEVINLVNQVFPLLTTDMSNLRIVSTATEVFPMLSSATLTTQHIPAEGTYTFNTIDGMSVIVPNFDKNIDILAKTLAPTT